MTSITSKEKKTKVRENIEMTVLILTILTLTFNIVSNYKVLKSHSKWK